MSEQREALAEANVCGPHHFVWTWPINDDAHGSIGVCELCGAVTTAERDARLLADAEQRGADRVAAAALAVVKRACDIECKSPGKHTGCSSHEPYRALIGAALTTALATAEPDAGER